ncbi:hypothetical protein ZWY2020_051286 [Hordeum vulgare]|nr:hypothetical protein ZWY2020_051286 [Hordeum vulgare]
MLSKTVDARLQGDYGVDEACLVQKIDFVPAPVSWFKAQHAGGRSTDGETPLPELKTTQLERDMQVDGDNGFSTTVMSYPQLMSSFGAVSDLSGGR